MAKSSRLDVLIPTIDSLYDLLSPEVRAQDPGSSSPSDREIIEFLAADSRVLEPFSFQPAEIKQNKDLALSKQLLAQGTQSMFKKNYNEALMYINTASRFVPQMDNLLCGLYQLRSTVLLQLKKYEECIVDLDKALEKGAPEKVHHKLYDKLAGCYTILKQYHTAKEKFQMAAASLSHAAIPDEKKQALEEHFKEEITMCDKEIDKHTSDVSDSGSGACIEASSDELNSRIAALNLEDPELPRHPLYPQLVNNCDVVHVEGKGVIATRDIKPGEVLLTEQCHSAVLFTDHWSDNCWWCLKKVQVTVPCPGCTSAVFCSEECLNKAQEGFHRTECGMMGLLQALAQRSDTVLCLFALRVLTSTPPEVVLSKVKDETHQNRPITNGESHRVLDPSDPVSMYEFISTMPQDQSLDGVRLGLYSLLLAKYLLPEGENKEKVIDIATLLSAHQRSLNITNKAVSYTLIMKGARLFYHSVRIGRALWPTLSLLNHSCDPVADTVLLNYRTIVLRSKISIPDGHEVTISYTGHYSREDRDTRQGALQQGWGFICGCRACEEDWPQYLTRDDPPTDVVMKCLHCQKRLLKVHSLSQVTNQQLICPPCDAPQYPMRISDKLQEIDIWREKLRSKLLSDLDPTEVYQEVMTSQQVLDHVTEKPNLFHARMSELVHHVFLLMSDRQIVSKLEGEKK